MQKSALRKPLLQQRTSLATDDKMAMDRAIGRQLLAWVTTHTHAHSNPHETSLLGVYSPMRGEPDLQETFAALHAKGIRLALPTIVSNNAPLKFVEWTPGEAMLSDRFGAMVPVAEREEVFPQTLIIPCVGFNRQLFRLGYGGGFYDRTVAHAPRPQTVGVAYSLSQVEFEAESFDIPMDYLITEQALIER